MSAILEPLSPGQEMVKAAICDLMTLRGYPPTVRELCEATGLSSPSTIHEYLNRLEAKGHITRDRFKPRALVVHEESGDE